MGPFISLIDHIVKYVHILRKNKLYQKRNSDGRVIKALDASWSSLNRYIFLSVAESSTRSIKICH